MPTIHPSALVDPSVQLADDVEVGPWCHLQGEITIGAGTKLLPNVHINGPTRIGTNNTIYPNTCIGFAPQDRKFDHDEPGAGVVIGNDNTLRESVTIHRATADRPTTLGDDNYLMAGAHLGHDSSVGSHCNIANNVLLAGHAQVGDYVTMGGGSAIHQFCRVGQRAMVAGVIAAIQDVLPFTVLFHTREIIGLNLIGLRRSGMRDQIKPLQKALEYACYMGLSNKSAIARIRSEFADVPACMEIADFIETTKRGISPFNKASKAEASAERSNKAKDEG